MMIVRKPGSGNRTLLPLGRCVMTDAAPPKTIRRLSLWEDTREWLLGPKLFCRCGRAGCGYLLRACSLLCLGLGELGWCNHLGPGNCRALLRSLKMFLPSVLLAEARGGGSNYPWRSHGIQLEAAWFSVSSSVWEMDAWLRASYAEQPKREGETRSRTGWGESCPSRRPPGACFPAAILSLQPPPVPWLWKPAEVQPTFATCRAKMSQSLRFLKMTQAQLTHMYLVRGIGKQQKKNIVRVSDVPNLFLLAAKSNFVHYRRAIGNF